MRIARRFVIAALALAALGACAQKPDQLTVVDAWVRLGATPTNPAAGYFTIQGGPTADKLVLVFSPVVIRTEMHETTGEGGMASMKKIDTVDVPAGATVEFKPGGKHLMLFNVNPGILPPRTLPLTLNFASGTKLEVQARVFRAGDK